MGIPFQHPAFLAAMGIAVGTLGTLVGAGGGFLLVPLFLGLFPSLSPEEVTAASLAVVALNSSSGSIAYARLGRIDFGMAVRLFVAMVPGSLAGVGAVSLVPKEVFQRTFGLLLLGLALYLVYSPKTRREPGLTDLPTDLGSRLAVPAVRVHVTTAASAVTGFIASFMGIGGGPIHVPLLIYLIRFPVALATGTSQLALCLMAWTTVAVHYTSGTYSTVWWLVVPVAGGAVAGAQLGAWLTKILKDTFIVRLLGIVLGIVALRLLI